LGICKHRRIEEVVGEKSQSMEPSAVEDAPAIVARLPGAWCGA